MGVTNIQIWTFRLTKKLMWYMKIHVLKSLNQFYANWQLYTLYNKTSTMKPLKLYMYVMYSSTLHICNGHAIVILFTSAWCVAAFVLCHLYYLPRTRTSSAVVQYMYASLKTMNITVLWPIFHNYRLVYRATSHTDSHCIVINTNKYYAVVSYLPA